MRTLLVLGGLVSTAMLLPVSETRAQSGVISGPPQVQSGPGGQPAQGPSAGRGDVWIAVVGGFDGTGRKVSVGYSGHQRSRAEAENAAIKACVRSDASVSCRNPFAVSSGCLYIVPGSRQGGMTWGRGGTREIAFDECRRGGYACPSSKLVGGCVPGVK